MKKYKIFQNKWVKPALYIVGGLILGWLVFHHSEPATITEGVAVHQHSEGEEANQIWTCAMHPQIRMDKPGDCPICGMELIPVKTTTAELDPDAVQMTKEAIKLAEVQTTIIGRQDAEKEVSLYGKVQADERRIKTQPAHIPGRIEELLISFTGETVTKGQVIARIYSPSLVTAQEELLQAKQLVPAQPALIDAAREKLLQWKLTKEQISAIEKNGKVQTVFDVTANVSGIVLSKRVNQGDYVQQGAPLFEVADLSNVWVLFDAYESDLPWIRKGNSVAFTLQSMPGQKFSGKITFIDPVINPSTRVALVRVEASNPGGKLKPEMFVNGLVTSALPEHSDGIVIPQSSVLWTGPRSVVYVKISGSKEPEFIMREIELGPALSNSYVVLSGLNAGEEIVTNGTFAIDASAQLAGKPSMMNPEGNQVSSGGMAGMDMGQGSGKEASEEPATMKMKDGTKMAKMEMKMIKVSGNCDLCKERIETAAKSVAGVMTAEWTAEKQMIHVEFDPAKTSSDAIQKAIAAVGHDTEKYKATKEIYDKLPGCCQYRK
ncbi:MAG: efflux RND transporter periplasmic adaptor subunit [Prolixibacteraceae bacterium]